MPEPPADLLELALTPTERRRVARLPVPGRWPEFLRYWTRKEAVLKQLGTGMATPLHQVVVDPGDPAGRGELRAAGRAGAGLWVGGLDLGDAWVGAVATAASPPALRLAELAPAALAAAG